jgi:hypothetical protein
MRRSLVAALALAASSLLAAPSEAGVKVGDPAPEMEGKEFINSKPITVKGLRGRVLLYDIFRTW